MRFMRGPVVLKAAHPHIFTLLRIFRHALLPAFILAALAAGTASATYVLINTADGAVDANWVLTDSLVRDGDDIANDGYNLDEAWIASDGSSSAFYFRANLYGSGVLPHDGSRLEARLDCNRDGSFTGSQDVVMLYGVDNAQEFVAGMPGG